MRRKFQVVPWRHHVRGRMKDIDVVWYCSFLNLVNAVEYNLDMFEVLLSGDAQRLHMQEFRRQWRAAQSRMLSALHLGDDGLRTLQPIQKRLLPPPEPSAIEKAGGEARISAKERNIQSPSGSRDTLSAEESRGQSLTLTHPQGHADSRPMSPDLSSAQWARIGGRGRLMAVSDTQRGWSRGWGSAVHSRRAVVAWGSMERAVRSGMDDDDNVREGGRQRLLRSEMGQRAPSRGRRAASVESRLDPRWSMTRAFHDRIRGYTEPRDEETGALLVEFNDGTDETAADLHGVEGGSAGSAETADTSRDGDEEVDNSRFVLALHVGSYVRPAIMYEQLLRCVSQLRPPKMFLNVIEPSYPGASLSIEFIGLIMLRP